MNDVKRNTTFPANLSQSDHVALRESGVQKKNRVEVFSIKVEVVR